MKEEYKAIKGYSNYEVSNKGNVRNSKAGRVLKGIYNTGGYHQIILYNNKIRTKCLIHRLVAVAFISNESNLPEVNHKDEDKVNNNLSNLEWCSSQYNIEYSKAKHYTLKSPTGEKVEVFNMRKFCRDNSLHQSNMIAVANGKHKSCKGWRKW